MKTACVVLMAICGLVADFAAAPNSEAQQGSVHAPSGAASNRPGKATSSRSAKRHVIGAPSATLTTHARSANPNRTRRNASGANTFRLMQVPLGQQGAGEKGLHTRPQRTANKSGSTARQGPSQSRSVSSSAVRSPRLFPSSSSSLDNVRHRGPNPAVVGGLTNAKATTIGGIDGSRISRKR